LSTGALGCGGHVGPGGKVEAARCYEVHTPQLRFLDKFKAQVAATCQHGGQLCDLLKDFIWSALLSFSNVVLRNASHIDSETDRETGCVAGGFKTISTQHWAVGLVANQ